MGWLEIPCNGRENYKIKMVQSLFILRSPYQKIAIYDTELFGRCLFLDDVIQCTETDHELYDRVILNKVKCSDKELLILGGGDGNVAETALKLNPNLSVTIVEIDDAVIRTCEEYLSKKVFNHPNVSIVIDDAVHFMEQSGVCKYDCIVLDLTEAPTIENNVSMKDYYLKLFSLGVRYINRPGWISAYLGCDDHIAKDIVNALPHRCSMIPVSISSFGEPCFIGYQFVPRLST